MQVRMPESVEMPDSGMSPATFLTTLVVVGLIIGILYICIHYKAGRHK
jgi:hypothetical protein